MLEGKFDLVHCKKENRLIAYSFESCITATQERSMSTLYSHLFFLLHLKLTNRDSLLWRYDSEINVVVAKYLQG